MLLTKIQKDFIISTFFHSNYLGGVRIANVLLDVGHCIVAGSECIFVGGISNYIRISSAKNYQDCSLYEFSFDEFMRSELYSSGYRDYRDGLLELDGEIGFIMPLNMRRDLLIAGILR